MYVKNYEGIKACYVYWLRLKKSWDMLWGILHNVNEQNCIIIKTKTTWETEEENKKEKNVHSLTHKKMALPSLHFFQYGPWTEECTMLGRGKITLRILFTRKDFCWLSYLTKKAFLVTLVKMSSGKPLHSLCNSGNGSQYKVTSHLYQQLSSFDVGIPHLQGFHLFLDMWSERYDFLAPYHPNYRT